MTFSACHRIIRKKNVKISSIENVDVEIEENHTELCIEIKERDEMVHSAIQSLPDSLRVVTSLYYIGGMSQLNVGNYLSITESTVKKRLYKSRLLLKEAITKMAKSILKSRKPAEHISAKVIAELVSRPQPLLIKDHPIRVMLDKITEILTDYQMIESKEVEEKEIYPSIQKEYAEGYKEGYHLDDNSVLRTQTSGATFKAIKGKTPPVKFITAGRVYRTCEEDEQHSKVFHQLDGICVMKDASSEKLESTLREILSTILGDTEIQIKDCHFNWVDKGKEVEIKINNKWESIAGCGFLKSDTLKEAGYDTNKVSGFAFGIGLERLTMCKLGLTNIKDLWSEPYLNRI